jgi:menaquinone-dependent protoporphyrinogen IX oxidase
MASTIIIYSSKYGSTKQYAEWIAADSGADIVSVEKADPKKLAAYGTVVFGACVYVGKMRKIDFLAKNAAALEGKKVLVFAVCSSKTGEKQANEIMESNIPAALRPKVKFFSLAGKIGKLDLLDSILIQAPLAAARSKYKKTGSEEDRRALEKLEHFDGMGREQVAPIVAEIKG